MVHDTRRRMTSRREEIGRLLYVCVLSSMRTGMRACVRACICIYVGRCVCMYICMYVCVCTYRPMYCG